MGSNVKNSTAKAVYANLITAVANNTKLDEKVMTRLANLAFEAERIFRKVSLEQDLEKLKK